MAAVCRFCESTGASSGGICNNKACFTHLSQSCKKKKSCGHACCGVTGELVRDCPPCLKCSNSTDICVICIEPLSDFPMLTIDCGHSFHYGCLKNYMSKSDPNIISFNNTKCPLCRVWIKHRKFDKNIYLKKNLDLFDKVRAVASKQVKLLGLSDDVPEVIAHGGDTIEYAMWKFEFFKCKKCKEPYCGGQRICGDSVATVPAKKWTCPDCDPQLIGTDVKLCDFCDDPALYFCWGTNFMCNDCHQYTYKYNKIPPMKKQ